MTKISGSEDKYSVSSSSLPLRRSEGGDSHVVQLSEIEVTSSNETKGGTQIDTGLAAITDLYFDNKRKEPLFKLAETEFWISNRLAPFLGPEVSRMLRKAKNFETQLLVENQEP